jgi:hypothetical protein
MRIGKAESRRKIVHHRGSKIAAWIFEIPFLNPLLLVPIVPFQFFLPLLVYHTMSSCASRIVQ